MAYTVKELFYTLQGEGGQAGRAAVFIRLAGCNLWSGREEDRAGAACRFCDTDFVGGQRYGDAVALAQAAADLWPGGGFPLAVVTGGEPGLQLDDALVRALHDVGFEVAIETNGTVALPAGLDWVCVSPKAGTELTVMAGEEIKLVWPQDGIDPQALLRLPFRHFFLQPRDGAAGSVQECVSYCLTHPGWRLSLQTHKLLGIP